MVARFTFDVPRQERFEVVDGRGGRQVSKEMLEVSMRLDPICLGGFDQGVKIRTRCGARDNITEVPVTPADDEGAPTRDLNSG
jgi:hypothetical protein